MKTKYEQASSLENLNETDKLNMPVTEDTEIVVVSNTVRQRRARTPSSNETVQSKDNVQSSPTTQNLQVGCVENNIECQQQQAQVLPDLLPPQTFRLAETSALFSQISKNPQSTTETATNSSVNGQKLPLKRKNADPQAQMVEVKVKNINNNKMSVHMANDLEPQQGEIVDTVNILESVEPFVPEYVETVQIIDVSEDSDSSVRLDAEGRDLKKSKSKRSLCESPRTPLIEETETEKESGVELRPADAYNTSTPILRVEKQRISFEEKRKRMESERDILRDSEEETDMATTSTPSYVKPKVKRWRQLHAASEELDNSMTDAMVRDSFYNPDKELSFDVEPLVFSDDEDIPRFSMEMTQPIDSDSDTV